MASALQPRPKPVLHRILPLVRPILRASVRTPLLRPLTQTLLLLPRPRSRPSPKTLPSARLPPTLMTPPGRLTLKMAPRSESALFWGTAGRALVALLMSVLFLTALARFVDSLTLRPNTRLPRIDYLCRRSLLCRPACLLIPLLFSRLGLCLWTLTLGALTRCPSLLSFVRFRFPRPRRRRHSALGPTHICRAFCSLAKRRCRYDSDCFRCMSLRPTPVSGFICRRQRACLCCCGIPISPEV